jgi:hypothetical protein
MGSTVSKVRRQKNGKRRKEDYWHRSINPTPIPTKKGWYDMDEAIFYY